MRGLEVTEDGQGGPGRVRLHDELAPTSPSGPLAKGPPRRADEGRGWMPSTVVTADATTEAPMVTAFFEYHSGAAPTTGRDEACLGKEWARRSSGRLRRQVA